MSVYDVAILLKSVEVRGRFMAVRKKAETIHLRVSAISKACLEGLANAMGKTSTRVLEDLIAEAAESCVADADGAVDERFSGEDWTLLKALKLAQIPDEPILKKLRTYFLADRALSPKDKFLVEAILWSPDSFSGETDIFLESEGVIKNPDEYRVFKVDLNAINNMMPSLEDYAEFRFKNKLVSPSYREYMMMVEKK
ncbi:TPA: hypothetical protein QEM76_005984 [Pseudomonas putida]|uniref:Uncharacterized protein n=1 Tax=Pseudomonas qingdaonensis TaxID=2056231 RepID=A0ABX8DPC8_9PSED|nr:hypothetical protein [Pseudomonas qingdaonensis]QVL18170.1 hypothetical protein KH389_22695 [Pseudomonas qingdaonensis]HDS1803209.1 hypothetical protein [Pseudomonas putida]HDS1809184.1 hypothetical protein [Pseudomonas putida]